MAAKFFAVLTNLGAAKLANAAALGIKLEVSQMAVGDGAGTLPIPDPAQTSLKGEKRRASINLLTVDPTNTNQIIAEQVIPESEGGWWIREIGLFDKDGALIAIANCPETYKPQLQEGSGRTQTIRMILIVNSTDNITLKIDPAIVLATRRYVDDKVIEVKAYADDLMAKHVSAADPHTQYAPKKSPTFTGEPTAPTAPAGNNSTRVATTEFAQTLAGKALAKEQNGADITDKGAFRKNLNLGAFSSFPSAELGSYSQVISPDDTKYIFIANDGNWGAQKADGTPIPLSMDRGGLGARTPEGGRNALGLGGASTKEVGVKLGTVAAGDDSRITGAMQKEMNLSDLSDYATARSNMGLKGAALLEVGAVTGTVAAGDDSRLTGALQKSKNLSDLPNVSAARSNLGLGSASTAAVGTGANQIPDMSSFTSSSTWFKLPSGKIVQMGFFSTTAAGNTLVDLPIPFPNACRSVVVTQQDTTFPNLIGCIPVGPNKLRATTWNYNGGAVSGTSVSYIAIGD